MEDDYHIFRVIGSLTSDGVFVYNLKEKQVEYVNHSVVRIFDISHEAFQHQPEFFINHIIPEDVDHLLEEYQHLKERSSVENVEFRLVTHDNKKKTIVCNAYAIDGRAFCFVRDITSQRENEEYITNYGAKKDALLDIISHNLSGPLSIAQNVLSSLTNAVAERRLEDIQKHVELVRETTDHCIDIVTDFLEEEHMVSQHISVKRTRIDIIAKINNNLERLRRSYPSKRFVLTTDCNHLYASNDDVKFQQVLQNLLSNAVKFTADDGNVEVVVSQMAKSYSVSVKDNGIGIPDKMKPFLFEKYTRAGRPGLRGERSIGMGLYIVSKLVSLMSGTLTFESHEGKGSVFTIQFLLD